MKTILFALFIVLVSFKSPKDQRFEMHNQIDRIISQIDSSSHIGIEVVSLKNEQVLYQKDERKFFVPGSTVKLFTSAAALSILGVNFTFETQVLGLKQPQDGVLKSDLFLKGSGDPSLNVVDLEQLIFQLKEKGIECIHGNLILDHSEFDTVALGPGWMWDEGAEYWNSPMDALTVNHSCIDIWVDPSKEVGEAPAICVYPDCDYVSVNNEARTCGRKCELKVARRWMKKENVIDVEGNVPQDSCRQHFQVSVESPHHFVGVIFKTLLEQNGISFNGKVLEGMTPERAEILATHSSLPLSYLVKVMMKNSDNLYSNCIFKKIGAKRFGVPGTWAKGAQAMREFLEFEAHLKEKDFCVVDGSGESRYNMVSNDQMVQFLMWAQRQFNFGSEFVSSLVISGVDMKRLGSSKMKGKVRAKSGNMTGVAALAGYAETNNNEIVAFSIMTNGFMKPNKVIKDHIEDQIVKAFVLP